MAQDWIKMRTDLYRHPKVCLMADILMQNDSDLARYVSQNLQRDMTVTRNVTRNAVVGALLSLWGVIRHRGVRVGDDIFIHGAFISLIDDIADLPGIGEAMEQVGWAVQQDEALVFPRFFQENNADPDEIRKKKNAERQARYRTKKADQQAKNGDVTVGVTRNVTITHREREEKEKEIKEKIYKKESGAKRALPEKFSVTPEMRAWAESNVSIDIDQATEQWKNSMLAHGRKYVDWGRAWQNGMINAQKWANEKKPPQAQLSPSQIERFVEKAQADEAGIYMATVNGRIYTVSASGRVTAG